MTRGGFQRESRLATAIAEIRINSRIARQSRSRSLRDRLLEEIDGLCGQCARYLPE